MTSLAGGKKVDWFVEVIGCTAWTIGVKRCGFILAKSSKPGGFGPSSLIALLSSPQRWTMVFKAISNLLLRRSPFLIGQRVLCLSFESQKGQFGFFVTAG